MTVLDSTFLVFQVPYNLAIHTELRCSLEACELDIAVVRYSVFHRAHFYYTPLTLSLDRT